MSLYFELEDSVLACSRKVGSSTFSAALQDRPILKQEEAARFGGDIVLFVRHPVERLKSCHRMFYTFKVGAVHGLPGGASYEQFVDYVLTWPAPDNHFKPQVDAHTWEGRFLPTTVYKFEDLLEVWPALSSIPLGHENRGTPTKTPDYREREVLEYYKQDLEVWNA